MQNKSKKLNGVGAKRTLAKEIEASTKKLEQERWLKTPEGEEYLIRKEQEKRIAEIRAELKIGQLVWKDMVVSTEDPFEHGVIGNLCCKIATITDGMYTIDVEMLYIIVKNSRIEECDNAWGFHIKKGDVLNISILDLEKHVAKSSGNIWWKIKTY